MHGCDECVHVALLLYASSLNVPKGSYCRLSEPAGEADNKHHCQAGEAVRECDKIAKRFLKTGGYALPVGSFICVAFNVISE